MYFEYFLAILVFILIFLRLRKKIKKYNLIYNLNGFDGVYFHFVNKNFKQFSFLIDVESHPETDNFRKALIELKKFATKVKILGYFEASTFRK